jgi:small subunit ribosomal protein S8
MMTDPVSDMLTRIRNAIHAKREVVEVPFSKLKMGLVKLLEREGYLQTSSVAEDGRRGKILITLRYTQQKEPVINQVRRVSKPGRRVYVGYSEIKPVLGGMGTAILSTSKGLLTDKQAKEAKIGGELLCTIW